MLVAVERRYATGTPLLSMRRDVRFVALIADPKLSANIPNGLLD